MGEKPLVSVVVPAYEAANTIQRAVRSVLDQTMPDFEVLVVDDGAPSPLDLSPLAADPRLRLIRHPVNRGAAAARNSGMRAARGAWIAFLDADDAWRPTKLERQLEEARRSRESPLVAIASGWQYFERGRRGTILIPVEADTLWRFAGGCWFCPGSTLLIRREAMDRVGLQDEALTRLEDYDWFLRFARAGGALRVAGECLVDIHRHRSTSPPRVLGATDRLREKYLRPHASHYEPDPAIRRRMKAYLALNEASVLFYRSSLLRGAAALLRSYAALPRMGLQVERFWFTGDAAQAEREPSAAVRTGASVHPP